MSNSTITASITYPTAEIEAFADNLGYQPHIPNPAYSSSVDENMVETDNGEPRTIDNPEEKEDFVKRLFKDEAVKWFTQFAERTATTQAKAAAEAQLQTVKEQVKAAITIS